MNTDDQRNAPHTAEVGGGHDSEGLHCLVTGASGYIGGRLVPELLEAGHSVRCLARSPDKLRDHPWASAVESVRGDVTDPDSVAEALRGIDVAYYLVHSLGSGSGFEETDRRAARVFADQAQAAGVRRIVYLGGLTPRGVPENSLSPHLRSRTEVGRVFLDAPVPATVLRAGVVIGSGSASFEMLRYLTERLPVMVTPSWVHTRTQPIGVRDVLRYLVGSATMPDDVNRTFDIGGPDVVTYREMMCRYAVVAGLPRRLIVPVPVLTPRLSSHWVGLVTPCPPPSPGRSRSRCATRSCATSTTSPGTCPTRRVARCRSRRRSPGLAQGAGGAGRHPLVVRRRAGCAQRPAAHRPGLGGRQPLRGRTGAVGRRVDAGAVEGDRGDRRRQRLVLVPARLGRPGLDGPLRRRCRTASRTARRRAPEGRRLPGLLAGRGDHARRTAAAAGRDAAARPRLAGDVRGDGRRRPHTVPPARSVPPARTAGPRLLVVRLPFHAVVFGGMARNITRAAAQGTVGRRRTSLRGRLRDLRGAPESQA